MQKKSLYFRPCYFLIFLLISLLKKSCPQLNIDMSLVSSVLEVQQLSTYSFTLNIYGALLIKADSKVIITFPTQYQIKSLTPFTCNAANGWPSVVDLVCSYFNRQLTITEGFPNDINTNNLILQFDVLNFQNPIVARQTDYIYGSIMNTNGTVVAQTNSYSGAVMTSSPGTLSLRISTSPSSTNTNSTITFTVTTHHKIPKDGYLTLRLNTYWSTDQRTQLQTISGQPLCLPLGTITGSIHCDPSPTSSTINVDITGLFRSGGFIGELSFSLFPFLTPPTVALQGSFSLFSFSPSSEQIDSIEGQFITGTTTKPITQGKILVVDNTVSTYTQVIIHCYINNVIQQTDMIRIQFPSQFDLSAIGTITAANYAVTDVRKPSSNVLTFTSVSLNTAATIQFMFNNVGTPSYSSTFAGFQIGTFRSQSPMDFVGNPFIVYVQPGTLSANFSALNYQVGAFTTYQLQIKLSHEVYETSTLVINFSVTQYSFLSPNSMSCRSTAQTPTASTACLMTILSPNSIKFSNIFLNSTKTLNLTIINIRNPYKLGLTTSLDLVTYTIVHGNQYAVDKSNQTDINLMLIARKMKANQIDITSTSSSINAVCDIQITLHNSNPTPMNSFVNVIVPNDIKIPNNASCNFPCSQDRTSTPGFVVVKFQLSNSYGESSLPKLTIQSIRNPISTSPTGQFGFAILNQNFEIIQYRLINSSKTYKASISSAFKFQISRTSTQNSIANVHYTFSLGLDFDVVASVVLLYVPNQIACAACSKQTLNATHYIIQLTDISSVSKMIIFQLTFTNHYSFQPLNFYIRCLTSIQLLYQYGTGEFSLTNDLFSSLDLDVAWTNAQLLSSGSMLLSNFILSTSYQGQIEVKIIFDDQFNLSICTSPTNTLHIQSPTTLTLISSRVQLSSSTLQISKLIYPSSPISLPIQIILSTISPSYSLAKLTSNIVWSVGCNFPCKKCKPTNISYCTSCYNANQQEISVSQGYIKLDTNTNTCVQQCNTSNYYDNVTQMKCLRCDTTCLNCFDSTFCTSCKAGSYLLKANFTCFPTECPIGHFIYSSLSECKVCTPDLKCQTCSDSLSCDSCKNGTFFYINQCNSDCPVNITVRNFSTRKCDPCLTNCAACILLADFSVSCLSCAAGFYLDNGGCYSGCRTPGFVPNGNNCTNICYFKCLTCITDIYTCKTCSTSLYKYYFNNSCVDSCDQGYYPSETTPYSCLLCRPPCLSCLSSSVSSCTRCISPLVLLNSTCQSTCPTGLYQNLSSCSKCVGLCKTCLTQLICMSCLTNYSLFGTTCMQSCPEGYVSYNEQCNKCISNCKTCKTVNFCITCWDTTYLYNGSCVQPCPTNYYPNTTILTCIKCYHSCKQCLNQTYCYTCQSGFQLSLTNQCLSSCLNGYVPVNGVCTICHSNCTSCIQSTTSCLSCQPFFYFSPSNSKCYSTCIQPLKYYTFNSSCLLLCIQPSYQQFVNISTSQQVIYCRSCPTLCKECVSADYCTACITGTLLYNNSCHQNCPNDAKYYIDGQCTTCNIAGCYQCIMDKCQQCQSNLLIIGDSLCISSCSVTQAYNTTSKQCITVIENKNITNSTTSTGEAQSSMKFVPFPYLILCSLIVIFGIILHFGNKILILPFCITIISVCVSLCSITNIVLLYFNQINITQILTQSAFNIVFLVLAAAILLFYLLNIVNLLAYLACQLYLTKKWAKIFALIVIIIGLFVNFNTYQIFNSKAYNFISKLNSRNDSFWLLYSKLMKISFISYLIFISAGIYLTFSLDKSTYLFYSSIQVVVLSILIIILLISNQYWPIDVTYKQEQQYQNYEVNDSINKLDNFSINQKQTNSQIQSQYTAHAKTQFSPTKIYRKMNENEINQNLIKTRSQFLLKTKNASQKLQPQRLKQAIDNGMFRQDHIDQRQKLQQEKQLSLLQSASKMYRVKQQQFKLKQQIAKQNNDNSLQKLNQVNIFVIQDDIQQNHQVQKVFHQKTNSNITSNKKNSNQTNSNITSKQRLKNLSNQNSQQVRQNKNSKWTKSNQYEPQQQISSKQQLNYQKYEQQTQKQDYFYNPNIIFEAIDEQEYFDENETKGSQINKNQQNFYKFYKDQISNRSDQTLLYQKTDIKKIKPKQKNNKRTKPKINLINDIQVDLSYSSIDDNKHSKPVESTQSKLFKQQRLTKQSRLIKQSKIQKQIKSSKHSNNQQLKKLNHQQSKQLFNSQIGQKQSVSILLNKKNNPNIDKQKFQNIFQPRDDLQINEDDFQTQINRNTIQNKKWEIIHADLQSIQTVSQTQHKQQNQRQYQSNQQHQYKNNTFMTIDLDRNKKNPFMTVNLDRNAKKSFEKPTYNSLAEILEKDKKQQKQINHIEDLQDFEQDNTRPSMIFKPIVKNLLSNRYDQLPLGIKQDKRAKRVSSKKLKKPN